MEHEFDVLTGIERSVQMVGRLVAGIREEEWPAASPCEEWSVRDVLNHVVGGMRIFVAELTGRAPEAEHEADWLGLDPQGAFTEAAELDLAAWRGSDAMAGMVTISLGTLPASFAAVIHLLELVGHGVDLAVATEQIDLLDERLCEDVLELLAGMGGLDAYRVPGVFGSEVQVDSDALAHARLAGYLGRHAVPAPASVASWEVVAT
ncbi:hypothetical protein ASG76_14655 [Nocardioides sp. Soil774]|uniref:TIGR03086 family metal-binding protein n=1 Tax=Nocardioides sp. Soil774 TaxID=1736408 RepID=UPI0007014D2E|nr:TIGR03086 family metal-binding protein [Nocardioides sp. Soil774]KRE93671.1 hypothetical protein ASG76_14655 [Nocardioides sp. Soil774]